MPWLSEASWRLSASDLIDSGSDDAFDRVARLAAQSVGAPVSLATILDAGFQVFKGAHGLPEPYATTRSTPISRSFCRYVIEGEQPLIIEDARTHPLVKDNPAIEELGVVAYLGLPLRTPNGSVVGSLSVIDHKPRHWSPSDRRTVEDLVAILDSELALREEIRFRQRAEEQARLMSREMEHRVKNSLSTVQAVIALSVRASQSPEEIRSDLLERVASLSSTHSLLVESEDSGAYFGDIVRSELKHYGLGTRIHVFGPDVLLNSSEAVIVGMVVHELATNATKYGALAPGMEGLVAIDWRLSDAPRRRLAVSWRETIGPDARSLPIEEAAQGFGSELLDTLIVRQLHGTMKRDWTERGLLFEAVMELAPAPGPAR
ncbi:sensor histidine kinase [Aurantimonas sp. VKM B-3413]|uniref:sensor histidine kinase n=1 Tax=Aurantimonas sp. VKM B-3413 TaxID=2779401 RepID=UPI001E42C321|nr:HWE histidine kinase domain-containing protein [Aurantimonas sp. VKM B-3413]MCB8837647.1 GAF domain-containing protein [Aurantimonas sp. VKM B-3413]